MAKIEEWEKQIQDSRKFLSLDASASTREIQLANSTCKAYEPMWKTEGSLFPASAQSTTVYLPNLDQKSKEKIFHDYDVCRTNFRQRNIRTQVENTLRPQIEAMIASIGQSKQSLALN